ncbi:hypothetical protein Tco_1548837 [Tanacetum coccineum]|uniref:Tf2-1-like SH3-like domain-containing protein n=1 Tax=Tanacetum coccineum TaxID=301880 RepID=A0ABQ5DQ15_9ASTR
MPEVSPWKGVVRFGKQGKLNPRDAGPFKVLAMVIAIAYKFELPRDCIPPVKVRWNSRKGPEFTWECEDQFKKKYMHLFTNRASSSNAMS